MTQRQYKPVFRRAFALLMAAMLFAGCRPGSDEATSAAAKGRFVRGAVVDANELPVTEARVRLDNGPITAESDTHGNFTIADPGSRPLSLTAWKAGYFIGHASSTGEPAVLELEPLPEEDYSNYRWVDPRPDESHEERCGNCHAEIFDEWRSSGHANSARNRRFMGLYEGTDWHGHAPAGWSLRGEHPLGVGVCTSCHAPGIDFDTGASDDLHDVRGVSSLGVHCDFCHKIQDLVTNDFGLVHGRFGFRLLRPREGQLFFGPLDDVARGEDTYSPLQHESRYCASCHEGVVFGVHVYSTYSEWLESPAKRRGQSCQTCHMAPTGRMANIAPGAGGLERDPATLASHSLLPGGRTTMLRNCLDLSITLKSHSTAIDCRVTLTARNVGHRVPTGFIDRHLILVVEALDGASRQLPSHSGPTLSSIAGDKLSSQPGRWFGRLLTAAGGEAPIPFWRPVESAADTRLRPEEPVTTTFSFPTETRQVRVRVLYRRFWKSTADDKQWPDDTITVFDERRGTREKAASSLGL